jgi:hypothetical protein
MKKVESATAKRAVRRSESGRCPDPSAAVGENSLMLLRNGGDLAVARALPSEAECAAVGSYLAKGETTAPMARTKVESRSGVTHLSFDHANQTIALALVANAFGTGSPHFVSGLLAQLADVSRTGAEVKSTELDFMLTVVRGIEPKDETEALLAVQMAAIHNATVSAARRLNHVQTIPQQDSASNALNKLARTFAAQLEALKKYRSGSEPSVKVQRLTVNDGGQAIVGNIQHGGDDENSNRSISSSQPCGTLAPSAALLSHVEAIAPAVPGASGKGQEGLPVPRGARRSTKRLG